MLARIPKVAFSFLLVVLSTAALAAEDLSGASKLLCAPVQGSECRRDSCSTEPAWNLNLPQFIEIDFEAKTLSSTAASGENRSTAIKTLEREDGLIVLQGVDNVRAFSFVITEETGLLSAAVAREEVTVSVFGACTPLAGQNGDTP